MMGGAGASALTPEQNDFYATPPDPCIPDGPPIFDATRDIDIASMSPKLIVIY
jgi:hypothetical protein